MGKVKEEAVWPLGKTRSWDKTPGTYIAGQAHIDGADAVAMAMETRWGAGRLRLLVSAELREKYDRQRYLFNQAIWHGDLEAVRRESSRMIAAWQALDKAATNSHAPELSPDVWELSLDDGTVVAIVRTTEEGKAVVREGRRMVVYTLDEIGRMLTNYRAVTEVKEAFPGTTVTQIRRSVEDPLDAIRDTTAGLDDPLEDVLQNYGV